MVGLFNGVLITWLSIPAFVATLATMIFLRGLVLVVTNETTFKVAGLSSVLSFLGRGMIFKYISFPLLIFIAAIAVASFVLATASDRPGDVHRWRKCRGSEDDGR